MMPVEYRDAPKFDHPRSVNKVCLVAIDGWGCSPSAKGKDPNCFEIKGDAIRHAATPCMDALQKESNMASLAAHGLSVGLPADLMGNSEVGHLNIGAGRVVYQDIVRIDLAMENIQVLENIPTIVEIFKHAQLNQRIHFLGLVSDGGVHSHQKHLYSLILAAKRAGIKNCFVHFFADGRDTAPKSAAVYVKQLQNLMETENYGTIASVCGRYYAMDRDNRAERIQQALDLLFMGKGETTTNILQTIESKYEKNEKDEFFTPILKSKDGVIQENDACFFFNYRSDRMRQLLTAFLPENVQTKVHVATMTQYKSEFPYPVAFPPQTMKNVLSEVISEANVEQCHIAETEKYAHVTFFFNGGREDQFKGEDRVLVPSPKVATYDLMPEMSSMQVALEVAKALKKGYPFVMCNFAPPDMVGHTGYLEAAIKAVSATDAAIQVILNSCKELGYTLVVTADHGNAEKMVSENGEPHTAHTTARVPLCISPPLKLNISQSSALCDVAPTILKIMGLNVPVEMDGKSLI